MAYWKTKTKWKKFKGVKLPKVQNNRFISQGTSKEELEVANFLQLEIPQHKVYRGDRVILQGHEIDIYVPTLKFGLEFHGLYFHKDKDPSYHLSKAIGAEKAGVYLIQLFEDEWQQKKPLVIDLIRRSLGKYKILDLKDCIFTKVSPSEAKLFFEKTHLLGNPDDVDEYYGLIYQNSLIYCAGIQNKEHWIILRDTWLPGIFVEQGLAKLCKELLNIETKPIEAILDRRLFDGKDFKTLGFKEYADTEPNVYYSCDFEQRIPAVKMTESIKVGEDWFKYYDAGNRKLILK